MATYSTTQPERPYELQGLTAVSSGGVTGTNKIPESEIGPTTPYDPVDGPKLGEGQSPEVQLTSSLVNSGYDPAKAAALAQQLMAQASKTSTVQAGSVPSATSGTATTPTATAPTPIGQQTYQGLLGYGTGIGIGNVDPTTREVTDEELVQNQLEGLLSGDSRYIRNARQRGIEQANKRGQFLSSFAAGAAERSAIDAALPIATADAQAYRDVATQNMNALNNFALANLQRATTLDAELLGANTNIAIANLDAATRVTLANLDTATKINLGNLDAATQTSIANLSSQTQLALGNLQAKLQLTMQSKELSHQVGMEQLMQQGRVELTMLDGALREKLAHLEIDGQIDLAKLNHEQRLDLEEILQTYQLDQNSQMNSYNREAQHALMAGQAQTNYINYITSFANTDMDPAAAARLREDAWNSLVAEYALINGLYPEFPPITPTRG